MPSAGAGSPRFDGTLSGYSLRLPRARPPTDGRRVVSERAIDAATRRSGPGTSPARIPLEIGERESPVGRWVGDGGLSADARVGESEVVVPSRRLRPLCSTNAPRSHVPSASSCCRLTRSTVAPRTNRRLDNAIYLGFAAGASASDQRRFYRSDDGVLRRFTARPRRRPSRPPRSSD